MDIGTHRELDAALRLQRLAKRTRLLERARGSRPIGKVVPVLSALVTALAILLTRNQPTPVAAGCVALVLLVGTAVSIVADRVDALVALLEDGGVIGRDLEREPARA